MSAGRTYLSSIPQGVILFFGVTTSKFKQNYWETKCSDEIWDTLLVEFPQRKYLAVYCAFIKSATHQPNVGKWVLSGKSICMCALCVCVCMCARARARAYVHVSAL